MCGIIYYSGNLCTTTFLPSPHRDSEVQKGDADHNLVSNDEVVTYFHTLEKNAGSQRVGIIQSYNNTINYNSCRHKTGLGEVENQGEARKTVYLELNEALFIHFSE